MVVYKGKELIRFKDKSGGKNKSDVDGFYENDAQEKYFIKKPGDQGELFAELFAGLLLEEFKKRNLIDEIYFPSLICADVIRFEDGSYGLVQPLVSFDELHKVIGTSYSDKSDRDPRKEALFGPSYYTSVTKQGQCFGLSMALTFSLLLGAHSVHSGNIVKLKNNDKITSAQYGRIDWGDAFRHFAHDKNNTDILYAYENRGWFNYKSLTKDYFLNFKKIPGLFPAMADKAQKLQKQLNEKLLIDIVSSALKKIPADLIDQLIKDKMAGYMVMPSFKEVTFGPDGTFGPFALEMAKLLGLRLNKITELKDFQPKQPQEDLYASVIQFKPIELTVEGLTSFPEILKQWGTIAHESPIECGTLNLSELAEYFNQYVIHIANECDSSNLWASSNNFNIFTPYYSGLGNQVHGHAFVPQYKESTVIRQFFSLDTRSLDAIRFAGFEQPIQSYSETHPKSDWMKIQTLLRLGQEVIMLIKVINNAKEFGMDEAVTQNVKQLKLHLEAFQKAESEVELMLSHGPKLVPEEPQNETAFFYPIDDSELNKMSRDQLATLCLEQLNNPKPSPLIERIIKNDELWKKMDLSFESGAFNSRLDGAVAKIAKIREWRLLSEISNERTTLQVSVLQQQIDLFQKKLEIQIEQATQLNVALEQQIAETQGLKKQVSASEQQKTETESVKEELNRTQARIVKLKEELESVQKKESSALNTHAKEVNSLKEELETNKSLLIQLQEQVIILEKMNKELHSALTLQAEGRESEEQNVHRLTKELEQLQPQLKQLKQELLIARENTVSGDDSDKINKLLGQIKDKEEQLERTTVQIKRLEELNKELQKTVDQVTESKTHTERSVQLLTEELSKLKMQMEQFQEQTDIKDQFILELKQKLKDAESKTKSKPATEQPTTEDLKKEEQERLVKELLLKEITTLQKEKKNHQSDINNLQQLIRASEQAQKRFEKAQNDRKDIYFSRMERMAPILLQIQGIELKAAELSDREETEAAKEAFKLADGLRRDIKEYANSEEPNEQVALNSFKIKAVNTVSQSKDVLKQHREEWKYILANVTLGILLVGVGYAAAILINKQMTGNYTFFSKTDSLKQLEVLEDSISSKQIGMASGG